MVVCEAVLIYNPSRMTHLFVNISVEYLESCTFILTLKIALKVEICLQLHIKMPVIKLLIQIQVIRH